MNEKNSIGNNIFFGLEEKSELCEIINEGKINIQNINMNVLCYFYSFQSKKMDWNAINFFFRKNKTEDLKIV